MQSRALLVALVLVTATCERRSDVEGVRTARPGAERLVREIHASCSATCRQENACFGEEDVATCTEECESDRSVHMSDECRDRLHTVDRCLLALSCEELSSFQGGMAGEAPSFPCAKQVAGYGLHCEDSDDALACNGICTNQQTCGRAGRVDHDACGIACMEGLWKQAATVGEPCARRTIQYDLCLALLSCGEFRDATTRADSRFCRNERLGRDRSCGLQRST